MTETTKRRRYFKPGSQRKYLFLQNVQARLRRLARQCREEGWAQEKVLAEMHKAISGDGISTAPGYWERLTVAEQEGIFGYKNALLDSIMDSLEFRYLINGTWRTAKEVCDRVDGMDPGRDCTTSNGHFVHAIEVDNGNRVEYRPY